MKQTFMLIMLLSVILCSIQGQEQKEKGPNEVKGRIYWAGLNYSYAYADMELHSRTEHAVWMGLDYGPDTLSSEQISSVNSVARFTSENNAVFLDAGMVFLSDTGSGWYVDGGILLGVTRTVHETYDRRDDSRDFRVTSPFSRLLTGVEFRIGYSFNSHWGLLADPGFIFSRGTNTDIEDGLDLPVYFLTEYREVVSTTIASRVSLMASYRISKFTFSAGPGFYLAYNNRTYTIERTNPETGSTFFNESHSIYYNNSFMDGSVNMEWRFLPAMSANIYAGIGNDLLIQAGIRYVFER